MPATARSATASVSAISISSASSTTPGRNANGERSGWSMSTQLPAPARNNPAATLDTAATRARYRSDSRWQHKAAQKQRKPSHQPDAG